MKRVGQALLALVFLALMGALLPVTPSNAQTLGNNATWSALFFPNTSLSGQSVATTYTGLNQNWGQGAPTGANGVLAGIPADNFSARLSANIELPVGTYELIVTADDGARVLIADTAGTTTVIDFFQQNNGTVQRSYIFEVVQSGIIQFIVEYVEFTGNASLQFAIFQSDGGTPQPTPTPAPPAIVAVSGVRGLALRTGPFLGASLIGVARPDTTYDVVTRNTQEGLFTWYKIKFDEDTIGWSSGRYLTFEEGAPENVPLENTTIFSEVPDPPGTVIGVTRSVMNFRVLPSERVGRVSEVPQLFWGAEVEIIARTVQGGQDFWYQVKYSPDDSDAVYVGWIFAPFVGIAGGSDPIDTVPIR